MPDPQPKPAVPDSTTFCRSGAIDLRDSPESRPAGIRTKSCPAGAAPVSVTRRCVHLAPNVPFVQNRQMARNSGYQGGGTVGGKLGCAISGIVGFPLAGWALINASMGDCAAGAECIAGCILILAAVGIAGVVGVISRLGINAVARVRQDR
jgi:hypothetical protein